MLAPEVWGLVMAVLQGIIIITTVLAAISAKTKRWDGVFLWMAMCAITFFAASIVIFAIFVPEASKKIHGIWMILLLVNMALAVILAFDHHLQNKPVKEDD